MNCLTDRCSQGRIDCPTPGECNVWTASVLQELALTEQAIRNRPATPQPEQGDEPWSPATTALIVLAVFVGLALFLTQVVWGMP